MYIKPVDTEEEMNKLGRFLNEQDFFAFDTETDGIDPLKAGLVGMSFAVKENEAWYVPVPADKEEAVKIVTHFSPALQNRKSQKIGQNIKFDIIVRPQIRSPRGRSVIRHDDRPLPAEPGTSSRDGLPGGNISQI